MSYIRNWINTFLSVPTSLLSLYLFCLNGDGNSCLQKWNQLIQQTQSDKATPTNDHTFYQTRFWQSCLRPLVYVLPRDFISFGVIIHFTLRVPVVCYFRNALRGLNLISTFFVIIVCKILLSQLILERCDPSYKLAHSREMPPIL